jgi:hypothetical protein
MQRFLLARFTYDLICSNIPLPANSLQLSQTHDFTSRLRAVSHSKPPIGLICFELPWCNFFMSRMLCTKQCPCECCVLSVLADQARSVDIAARIFSLIN